MSSTNINGMPSPQMFNVAPVAVVPGVNPPTIDCPSGDNTITLIDNVPGGADSFNLYHSADPWNDAGFSIFWSGWTGGFPIDIGGGFGLGGTSYYWYITAIKDGVESAPSNHIVTNSA